MWSNCKAFRATSQYLSEVLAVFVDLCEVFVVYTTFCLISVRFTGQGFRFTFFFFFGCPMAHGVPEQWSDLSQSCELWLSCGNIRSYNPLCLARARTCILVLQRHCWTHWATAGTPVSQFLSQSFSSFFFWCSSLREIICWVVSGYGPAFKTSKRIQHSRETVGLQVPFKELELKASVQDRNYQILIIAPPISS